MKSFNFCLVLLLTISKVTFAQENTDASKKQKMDSIKNIYLEEAIRDPLSRPIVISSDIISSTNIRSDLYGKKLFDGKLSQVRTTALITVPVKSWGKNSVSASVSIFQQHFHLNSVKSYQPLLVNLEKKNTDKLSVGLTPTYTRVDSLFGHQIIYTASVTGLTSQTSSINKMSYLGGAIFTIKQNAVTNFSLGLLINIDPALNLPLVPVVTFWHKYQDGLEINVNLPQAVSVRKALSPNLWADFGTSLTGSIAFFKHDEIGIPAQSTLSTFELKTGPGIEYRFAKIFLVGISTGILTPIQAREFDREKNINKYFLQNKINSAPFANFSISLLPF